MQNKSGQNTLSTGTLRPYQPSSSLQGPLHHKKSPTMASWTCYDFGHKM